MRTIRNPDRALAATIYLMSCHARNGCPRLACIVGLHLRRRDEAVAQGKAASHRLH